MVFLPLLKPETRERIKRAESLGVGEMLEDLHEANDVEKSQQSVPLLNFVSKWIWYRFGTDPGSASDI